jgi:hypothetical protein
MAAAPRQINLDTSSEVLLQQTLDECEEIATRLRDLLRLADALIGVLPADKRVSYAQKAGRFRATARPMRGDSINDNILEIVRQSERVTANEVCNRLLNKGIPVDQKQVNNSLDYLVRREQLQRIGPGRYRIPEYGVGIIGDPDGRGYE